MALIISKDDEPRKIDNHGICFSGIFIRLTLACAENDAGGGKGESRARIMARKGSRSGS
jgi:hypothetical protein